MTKWIIIGAVIVGLLVLGFLGYLEPVVGLLPEDIVG